MKHEVNIQDLETYRQCPEKSRRERLDPLGGKTEIEYKYQVNLRKLLCRFYMELAGGRSMNELELRKSWSLLWKKTPGLISRQFKMNEASILNATSTEEERYILRGTKSLHSIVERKIHKRIIPVIVNEPYSLQLGQVTLKGTWDLVFKDEKNNYWVVTWSQAKVKQDTRFDLSLPVAAEAFRIRFGSVPGMLVDYILQLGDYLDPVNRTENEYRQQLEEARSLAHALSEELVWRSIGHSCNLCPYRVSCLGVQVVQRKEKPTKPRSLLKERLRANARKQPSTLSSK